MPSPLHFSLLWFPVWHGGDEKVALVQNYSDVKCKRQEKSMISRNLAVASYSESVFIVRTVIDKKPLEYLKIFAS